MGNLKGEWGINESTTGGALESVGLHGAVGCASSMAGGSCASGFLATGFSDLAGMAGNVGSNDNLGGLAANTAQRAVVGGLGSALGGGKFENGAVTGAFGYLFNYCAHNGCFSRHFNWNDARDQWRNGNGSTVTDVDASELNLRDATYTKNADGSYQVHTSIKFDTGAIYGTVTGIVNSDGTMSFRPDTYNFDMKSPFNANTMQEVQRLVLRDALTAAGLAINGKGTPYNIEFSGSIPTPKGLPK